MLRDFCASDWQKKGNALFRLFYHGYSNKVPSGFVITPVTDQVWGELLDDDVETADDQLALASIGSLFASHIEQHLELGQLFGVLDGLIESVDNQFAFVAGVIERRRGFLGRLVLLDHRLLVRISARQAQWHEQRRKQDQTFHSRRLR